MKANNIQHRHITMQGTKKETIPIQTMAAILEVVHDKRNHPLLIHCNHGRVCPPLQIMARLNQIISNQKLT
jgi:tyrosine-protein phosphatase SIW14